MSHNLLLAENIAKTFGEKTLFEGLTLGIAAGQKIALISRNGSGKTSLLNILTGLDVPDQGSVSMRSGTRIAYLEQHPALPADMPIIEAILYSGNEFTQAVRDYERATELLRRSADEAGQERLNEAMARIDRLGAWDYESRVREVITRFQLHDLDIPCGLLSGGQKKKVALARTLLEPADILILDEPTNHLDITMIEWLEEYLSREKQSLLVVTHDRYFLDKVCNEILELDQGRLHRYKGGYSYYLEKREERLEIENKEISKARSLMKVELDWMRRSPPARTTKSRARVEAFHELEARAGRATHEKKAAFQVQTQRIGGKVLEIHNLCKSYGENLLVDDFTYIFKRGEKVGITGGNGTGKTTFLNMLVGLERPDKGSITPGRTVQFGYFTQEGPQPDGDKRVLELVREIAEEVVLERGTMSASQFLQYFGFPSNLQYNYYSNLSGGEKRKLHLLMTLMGNPNFLILDEPTNDLDIQTLNLLEDFLQHYPGCLLIVSHDRYFMDKLADHIFVFEGKGKIKDHYGNYTEYYLARKQASKLSSTASRPAPAVKEKSRQPGKPSYKQLRELEELEKDIALLEAEKSELTRHLNSGEADPDKLHSWASRIGAIIEALEIKESRWLELSEIIQQFEGQ